jgi:hypothetical protein
MSAASTAATRLVVGVPRATIAGETGLAVPCGIAGTMVGTIERLPARRLTERSAVEPLNPLVPSIG